MSEQAIVEQVAPEQNLEQDLIEDEVKEQVVKQTKSTRLSAKEALQLNYNLLLNSYPREDVYMGNLCMHMILGQLPNILKLRYNIYESLLDLRIHVCVLSPSATNKGSIVGYMNKLGTQLSARGIHMQIVQMGKFTDSALVGTPGTQKIKVDKLDEFGDPILDANGKVVKEELVEENNFYGALHPSIENNILSWSEGSQLLDVNPGKSNYNQDTMNILQQCMNPMDSPDNVVSKTTGVGRMSYNTSCSLFIVTYIPFTLTIKITSTGLLQRTIVLIRDPTAEENELIAHKATRGLFEPAPRKVVMDDLIDHLEKVNEFAGRLAIGTEQWSIDEKTKDQIEIVQTAMLDVTNRANILVRSKLGEFSRRWSVNLLYNLILHHALLDLRANVVSADVDYAAAMICPIWQKLAAFIENTLLMDSKETEIMQKKYSYIVIKYYNLTDEINVKIDEKIEEMKAHDPDADVSSEENKKGWIRRDWFIAQLADDWRRSMDSVREVYCPVENDLFMQKETSPYIPDEYMPADGDLSSFEKITMIKVRPNAMKTIKMH
jgi:hypothetical protein